MRKGQEKILKKAEKYKFSNEAMEILSNEDLTLPELEMRFILLNRENIEEQKEVAKRINEFIGFAQSAMDSEWNKRMFTYNINNSDFRYVCMLMEQWKTNTLPMKSICNYANFLRNATTYGHSYCSVDELLYIIDNFIKDDDDTDFYDFYNFWSDFFEIIGLREKYKNVSFKELCDIAYLAPAGTFGRFRDKDRENKAKHFLDRVLRWRKEGKSNEEIVQLQTRINNGNYDEVCKEELEKHYPKLQQLVDWIEKDSLEKRNGTELYNCNNWILIFENPQELLPYLDFAKSVSKKNKEVEETRFNYAGRIFEKTYEILSIRMYGYLLSYNISLSGIGISVKPVSTVRIMKSEKCDMDSGQCLEESIKLSAYSSSKWTKSTEILLTYDGDILWKNTRDNWIPMSLFQLSQEFQKYPDGFRRIISYYIDKQIESTHYAWKDVLNYFTEGSIYPYQAPKLTIRDIQSAHSYDQAVKMHYKNADFINWGKADPVTGYLIMKCMNKVDENSKKELLKRKYESIIQILSQDYMYINPCAEDILVYIIYQNISKKDKNFTLDIQNVKYDIEDYIYICNDLLHKKVRLTFFSWKKFEEACREAQMEYTINHVPVIKIPTKTNFRKLRQMLPYSYEWVKTRKRIIEESMIQDYCVATYANDINKDRCAIYSMVDASSPSHDRYTIQFVYSKKTRKYSICQIRGKFNRKCPEQIWKQVQELLDE